MANPNQSRTNDFEENIPVVTIPGMNNSGMGNYFLIAAIIIAEAIAAYTIVAVNYPTIYEWVYGTSPGFGVTYKMENIVVNPSNTDRLRFLVVSVDIQMRHEKDLEETMRKEFIIKDAINSLLSQKTVEQLQSVEARLSLKQEIGIVINNVLKDEAVRNVYFTKYVMQ